MRLLPRPIDWLNWTVRRAGVAVSRGIAYGGLDRQLLDIYTPEGALGQCPVIVFFYGGSWRSGARGDVAFVALALARRGFVVVVPDYRLWPTVGYPHFVEDCKAATQWVAAQIGGYGGDARSLFLMGHSAGAYNAAMVALAADAPALAGMIGLAGAYDFLPLQDQTLQKIFAGPDDPLTTQPITYAHAAAPPMLLLTGAVDRAVLPRNTASLAAKLRQFGAPVETRVYARIGHTGLLVSLFPYLRWYAPVLRDILAFIEECRAGGFARSGSDDEITVVRRFP
ncbi:alpha/beta hydrolase [Acidocella sp.]|jgi:acetyl esterase/lipase|uniref:alpha/beta hydrolase n=1 Tax=Acidocella sp. TaxID=50710 RepID=UPI002F40DD45